MNQQTVTAEQAKYQFAVREAAELATYYTTKIAEMKVAHQAAVQDAQNLIQSLRDEVNRLTPAPEPPGPEE